MVAVHKPGLSQVFCLGPYAWGANSSLNCIYLLNGNDIEKSGMCGEHKTASLNVLKVVDSYFYVHYEPLLIEATNEEKRSICTDQHHATYHWKPQVVQENLDSCIKTHHDQHRWWKGDMKISNQKVPLGHWNKLVLNFELETDMAVVMRCQ